MISPSLNPLTTDDECTRHATLAACYQLAQSILKIGFALAKKIGGGGQVSAQGAVHMAAVRLKLPFNSTVHRITEFYWSYTLLL